MPHTRSMTRRVLTLQPENSPPARTERPVGSAATPVQDATTTDSSVLSISSSTSSTSSTSRGTKRKRWDLESDHRVWTTGYWPYADSSRNGRGEPLDNLWASGGCLDKFDRVRKARRLPAGAKAFEKKPAMSFLAASSNAEGGYYIPKPTVSESDAERTTGVDFTGTGRLSPNVKIDFLDDYGQFGNNGRTDGKLDVSWWGNCDQVALAGMLFEKPKRTVTLNGVRFTPNDIKGLLVVIADSQSAPTDYVGNRYQSRPDVVLLKQPLSSGECLLEGKMTNYALSDFRNGKFEHDHRGFAIRRDIPKDVQLKQASGNELTIPASNIQSVAREDIENPPPYLFHKTLKAWLGDKQPFAMDHDRGPHVWNETYDRATIAKTLKKPSSLRLDKLNGYDGPYTGGKLCFYEARLYQHRKAEKKYRYWIEKREGKDINGGWLTDRDADTNPNFLWRPEQSQAPDFSGPNPRNPFVLPDIVRELYEKSI